MTGVVADSARPALMEELEVTVEKLVAGGDGIARIGRFPIFISRAAPGDRLRVRVWQRKPDYGRAEILEILEPGPDRRSPPCPHFDRCGGCDLQHLEDRAQVAHKAAATRETLERLGGVGWPRETKVVAGSSWGYRLRARFRVDSDSAPPGVGYLAVRSNRPVPVDRCPILVPELEALLALLPARLAPPPPRKVEVAAGGDGATTVAPPLPGLGRGAVSQRVGEFTYAYDARCFFQAHRELLPELVRLVVGEWSGGRACDLYAGVGLFGLPLARRYERVIAVEADAVAVRYQRRNARQNGVGNLEVVGQSVDTWAGGMPEGIERLVVDPPRLGLTSRVRQAILRRRPQRVTYVSCHPGTLARDLKVLGAGYRLESLALVDLFPQTGHIEVVAQMGLKT